MCFQSEHFNMVENQKAVRSRNNNNLETTLDGSFVVVPSVVNVTCEFAAREDNSYYVISNELRKHFKNFHSTCNYFFLKNT
jgi:hypothetical protein